MKTINLSGDIGWEITDRLVNSLLPKDGKEDVEIFINSYGGEVFEAFAIYNTIRNYPGNITTIIKGVAASAAGIIYLAGKVKKVFKNSTFMAHEPWLITYGEGDILISRGNMLNGINDILVADLEAYTGKSEAEVRKALKNEIWLVGWEQIADAGLADELMDPTPGTEAAEIGPEPVESINEKIMAIIDKMKTEAKKQAENKSIDKVAASLKAIHDRQSSPLEEGEKNTKEEDSMDKAELKTKFPDVYESILSEGKKAVDVDAAVKAELERVTDILEAGNVRQDVIEAVKNKTDGKTFMKAELQRVQEKREAGTPGATALNSLGNGTQVPAEAKPEDGDQELNKWNKLYGKKEGEK